MARSLRAKAPIHTPFIPRTSIGAEQAYAGGNCLFNEFFQDGAACVLNNAGDNVSLAADCADHRGLAGIAAPAHPDFLVPMAVPIVSADVGLVNLNDAAELLFASTSAVLILWHMSQAVLYEPKPM